MNKKFLSAILFGALMVTSTGTFVSCKDYDDDIDNVQSQVDTNASAISTLTSQLSSLQTALSTAQATADAAKSAAAAAQTEAEKAAKLAESAAATAKAEAIAEAVKEVEALKAWVETQDYVTQDELAAALAPIAGKIEGIEGGLSEIWTYIEETLQLADQTALMNIIALQEDLEIQKEALNQLYQEIGGEQGMQAQLGSVANIVTELQDKVDAMVAQLGDGDTTIAEQVAALEASLNEAWENIAAANNTIGTTAGNLAALIDDNASAIEELWNEIAAEDPNSIRTQLGQVARLVSEIQAELVTIKSFCSSVKSLVFIPQVYVDGVEGLKYGFYTYKALNLENKDTKAEIAVEATDSTVANPVVYAQYHVNPRNADIEMIKNKLSFYVQPNVEHISTRGEASSDFSMTPEFYSYDRGILTVKVNITGKAASKDTISVFALNIDSVNVTSDFATLYMTDVNDIAIADATPLEKGDQHYRRAIKGIDAVDSEAKLADVKPWSHTNKDVKVDTSFVYTDSLNLNTIVRAHGLTTDGCTTTNIKDFGFAWKYEIVNNYAIGTDAETYQGDFINLSPNGVLTAKVYDTTGRAAIGRTPIIRVSLVDTNNDDAIVKCAYIKVRIVDTPDAPGKNEFIELNLDNFAYNCAADTNTVSVKEINLKIYNELGLSFEEFSTKYPKFVDYGVTLDPAHIGTVTSTKEQTGSVTEATDSVTWIIKGDDLWKNAKEDEAVEIEHAVRYYDKDSVNYVQFLLKSKIEPIKKVYNIEQADFITNYWDADKTYTKFNVAVPTTTTDEDPANCTFVNNLNSPFVTWPANSTEGTPGILKLAPSVTDIEYFFCADDVKTIPAIGDIKVTFSVSDDGKTLYAITDGMTTKAEVAYINNNDTANVVTYNKTSVFGKQLLNTGKMYTYIGAKGYICGEEAKEVAITFDGKDHFKANFVRPITIAGQAADNFIDAVDMGEKGSFIRLEDLINPYDWRNRFFNETEDPNDDDNHTNYWGYYGPFTITVDTTTALCDLNGEWNAVPTTVELKQEPAGTMGTRVDAKTSSYGFLTYKNNGTDVEAFNIKVKVTVNYGWGVINTDYITVHVVSTIAGK